LGGLAKLGQNIRLFHYRQQPCDKKKFLFILEVGDGFRYIQPIFFRTIMQNPQRQEPTEIIIEQRTGKPWSEWERILSMTDIETASQKEYIEDLKTSFSLDGVVASLLVIWYKTVHKIPIIPGIEIPPIPEKKIQEVQTSEYNNSFLPPPPLPEN